MLKLANVKIPYKTADSDYFNYVSKKLRINKNDIVSCRLLKRSLDARKENDIHYVCTFIIRAKNESEIIKNKNINVQRYIPKPYKFPFEDVKSEIRPVICGSGPAGLFCALMLARANLKPLVIERGEKVEERKISIETFRNEGRLNINSNIQFGEGGAGTFSDGKLTCGVNDERMEFVLSEFASHGAPGDILTNAKPHIGTDYLGKTVKNIREEIISLGGEFLFDTLMTDIDTDGENLKGINVKNVKDQSEKYIPCRILVCATGHSSRETYEMMHQKGFKMERKPFSVGLRIEHKREYINKLQYKEAFSDEALPTADYKLSCHLESGSAYTFCMCPGGEVVASASEEGGVVTNGMSEFERRDNNSNSAVLVSVTPDMIEGDDVLGGMYFQRELEKKAFELGGKNYFAPCQRLGDFLEEKESTACGEVVPSYKPGVKYTNIHNILPSFVSQTLKGAFVEFNRKMKGFASDDAILTGLETRSSAPVRILRDENGQANIKGVYPAGEGAGYAGGIMSSAVDGIKCAEKICYAIINA